jgi:hypothetical protein
MDLKQEMFRLLKGREPTNTKKDGLRDLVKYRCQTVEDIIAYSAWLEMRLETRRGPRLVTIEAALCGEECFWEKGFIGCNDGVAYYEDASNALRALAVRVLVEYGGDALQRNSKNKTFCEQFWVNQKLGKDNKFGYVALFDNYGNQSSNTDIFALIVKN